MTTSTASVTASTTRSPSARSGKRAAAGSLVDESVRALRRLLRSPRPDRARPGRPPHPDRAAPRRGGQPADRGDPACRRRPPSGGRRHVGSVGRLEDVGGGRGSDPRAAGDDLHPGRGGRRSPGVRRIPCGEPDRLNRSRPRSASRSSSTTRAARSRPRLVLRPATVSLAPGEQAMVRVAAELDDTLESGVRYRGEIAIPALSDRRIPIVLRRRAGRVRPRRRDLGGARAWSDRLARGAAGQGGDREDRCARAFPRPEGRPGEGSPVLPGARSQAAIRPAARPRRGRSAASPDEPR